MRRLLRSVACLAGLPPALRAQTVKGHVLDPTDHPIAIAQVYVLPAGPTSTTDLSGAFTLSRVRKGTDTLVTRRFGFRPDTLVVQVPTPDSSLVIHLVPAPAELNPVTTSALRQDLPRIFDRMQRHIGGSVEFGDSLRSKYPHFDIDDVINTDWKLRRYAKEVPWCRKPPHYYLDGILLDRVPPDPLSGYVRLRDIAAIETYRSPDMVNEPFIVHEPAACWTVILVWTNGFKQKPWKG